MSTCSLINVYLYTRYERFWHWLQTSFILLLLFTGFEVNGLFALFGFKTSVTIHEYIGLAWLIAFSFFIFWLFTTGEWRQYIPTTKRMLVVVRYYSFGIFRGEPHPVPKRKDAKHNPLQRLVYLSLAAVLLPVQMLSGFLYWGYNSWGEWGVGRLSLSVVATVHLAGAFGILSFLVVHLYMITTGHTLFAHTRAMITGGEEVEIGTEIEDWERKERRESTPAC